MFEATILKAFKKAVVCFRAESLGGKVDIDGHFVCTDPHFLERVDAGDEDAAEELNETRKFFEEIRCWVERQTDVDAIVNSMREEDMVDFAIDAMLHFIEGLPDVMLVVTPESLRAEFRANESELDRLEAEAQAFEDSVEAQRLGHKGGSNV